MVRNAQHLNSLVWGTFEELIDEYVCDVLNIWQHVFHLEWQCLQFGELVEDLQKGEVVFVIDFVKKYNHQETDEPQSAHWDCMQSTMHPVVVYYKCHCGKTTMDKIIHFTSDLKHDGYAVEEFERKTIEHLKVKNITIKCIYEFSDNYPFQYKSKIPFRILSKSSIPIMRNYFCEKHGKNAADGLIGRMSQFLYTVVVTKNADLPDAEGLHNFCKSNWKEKPQPGPCKHYERNFFLTTEIRRPKDTTTNTLQGIRQIHSIRSVGLEGMVEIMHSSCFYTNCKQGTDVCINNHLVLPRERKQLLGGKLKDATINHWEKVYERDV